MSRYYPEDAPAPIWASLICWCGTTTANITTINTTTTTTTTITPTATSTSTQKGYIDLTWTQNLYLIEQKGSSVESPSTGSVFVNGSLASAGGPQEITNRINWDQKRFFLNKTKQSDWPKLLWSKLEGEQKQTNKKNKKKKKQDTESIFFF